MLKQEVSMFKIDKYGFWKQENPSSFDYTQEYKNHQSTNAEMVYLRLGILASYFHIKGFNAVDIGSGNNQFVRIASPHFKRLVGFDVCGESITSFELYKSMWDIIFLFDVLEHYQDINDLFKINFERIMISFPETPQVDTWEQLTTWRHYKPNEHIYCLNKEGMIKWFNEHGYNILCVNHAEDFIRRGQDTSKHNITTILARRK